MHRSQAGGLRTPKSWHGRARALLSGLLCALLVETPLVAKMAGGGSRKAPKVVRIQQMEGEQRVLHALNRLTFGPRPGEVEEVERTGLDRWFEQQLDPQTIDDSSLDARLSAFPAVAMPQREMIRLFPGPQMLRAVMQGRAPLPEDPLEHAIYAHAIAVYRDAEARKSTVQTAAGAGAVGGAMPAAESSMAKPMEDASVAMAGGAAALRRPGAARVTFPATDSPEYTIPGKKNGPPAVPARAGESVAAGQDGVAQRPANRALQQHDESAFPEVTTLEILALAPEARVRRILAFDPVALLDFRRSLSRDELARVTRDLSPQQKETLGALQGPERVIGAEVLQSRLERDLYSKRQVEAVMTDLWLNHFNLYIRKSQTEPYLLPAYEREAIRPHALGRFEDLLLATARSPAMLVYLDNWESIGPESIAAQRGSRLGAAAKNPKVKGALKDRGLNENYARELMELHTLGVGCEVSKDHEAAKLDRACGTGYTQADVTEVAKIFSGWTIDRPLQGGEYSFEAKRHEPGDKTVLGRVIHEGGEKEGLELLHILAMSPATARSISTKLAVRFVSDAPPPTLIDAMSKSYLASDGDIRTVLRTMFKAQEFWTPEVSRAKVKTPLEFVTSALRATDADVTDAVPLVQALDRLGMPIYGMQTPNGYSWMSEPWVSTGALVARMNFALALSTDRVAGTRLNWPMLAPAVQPAAQPIAQSGIQSGAQSVALAGSPGNPGVISASEEERLERMIVGVPVSERTREAVLAQAGEGPTSQQGRRDSLPGGGAADARRKAATVAGLLLGSPEFQRR